MEKSALILGGTSGLGAALAAELLQRNLITRSIIMGSSVDTNIPEFLKNKDLENPLQISCNLRSTVDTCDSLTWINLLYGIPERSPDYYIWGAGMVEKTDYANENIGLREAVLDVNFRNAEVVSKQALKHMNCNPTGKKQFFIVLGSTASENHKADEVMYCAAHAAKRSWTESARKVVTNPNLHICYCLLGGMKTPFWDTYLSEHPEFEETYRTFNDPAKVAAHIIAELQKTDTPKQINAFRGDFV